MIRCRIRRHTRGSAPMDSTRKGSWPNRCGGGGRACAVGGREVGDVFRSSWCCSGMKRPVAGGTALWPLATLVLFIEQVLMPITVARMRWRGGKRPRGLGQAPCSLNTGPYCKHARGCRWGCWSVSRERWGGDCARPARGLALAWPGREARGWHDRIDADTAPTRRDSRRPRAEAGLGFRWRGWCDRIAVVRAV